MRAVRRRPGGLISADLGWDDRLQDAELFFKFSFGISAAVLNSDEAIHAPLDYFSWGRHELHPGELELSKYHEKRASQMQEHVATYLLAVQLDRALQEQLPNRFSHPDISLNTASLIIRQLRNAFAHDPLNPVWRFGQPEAKDQVLEVPEIMTLDTRNLEGEPVRWRHFGGPIALLRLLQHLRRRLLEIV